MSTESQPRFHLREWIVQGFILLALVALVFPGTFTAGEITLPGNLLFESHPWRAYAPEDYRETANWLTVETLMQVSKFYYRATETLKNGEWPLWNPLEFAGMPLLANVQSTVFYPPRLLHTLMDHYWATTLFILLKLWGAGMTAYICGRGMGLRVAPARFFSIGWMLSNYNLIWAYWPPPDVSVWAPIVLLGVDYLARGAVSKGFWTTSVGATLLLYAGHPETAFSFGLGIGAYFLIRLFMAGPKTGVLSPVLFAGLAWVVALGAFAAQLLPFLEYLPLSQNVTMRDVVEGEKHFLTNDAILGHFVPRFFGTNAAGNYSGPPHLNATFIGMLFPGIVVWLAVLLLFTPSRLAPSWRPMIIALTVPAVISFIMPHDWAVLRPIQELPVLDAMWRIYYVSFGMLALPLLGAVGLENWTARYRRWRELSVPIIVLGAILAYCAVRALALMEPLEGPAISRDVLQFVLLETVIAAVAVLALGSFWTRPGAKVIVPAAIVLMAADLLLAVWGLLPTAPRDNFFKETQLTSYLRELPNPSRVSVTSGGIRPGLMYSYGIEEHWGHDGIYPERIITFYGRLGSNIWNAVEPVASVTHYLNESGTEPAFPLDTGPFMHETTLDNVEVYRNAGALPRAFLVPRVEVYDSVDALFARMADPSYDPGAAAVTAEPPAGSAPEGNVPIGRATVTRRTATTVDVMYTGSRAGVLVLADAYYPGWTAKIDDETPAEIFPVYHAFRGIVVPEGQHTVEFRYHPASFRIGLAISIFTFIVVDVVAIGLLLRRRNWAK